MFGWSARRGAARRAGAVFVVAALAVLALPSPAGAVVRTGVGLRGAVLGRAGWYGSYDVARVGVAFCLDAERLAPDSDYDYVVGRTIDGVVGAQIAYVASRFGATRDPVEAVAAKLVLHDLQGARYPRGELDVLELRPADLSGFGGREAAIVRVAQRMMTATLKSYRLGPYRLSVSAPKSAAAGEPFVATVKLVDARRRPIAGAKVVVRVVGGAAAALGSRTGADGRLQLRVTPTGGASVRLSVSATAPSATPLVYHASKAGMATRAQRVVVAGDVPVTQTTVTITEEVVKPPVTTVTVTVRKTGDATAYHGVDGAVFELRADAVDGARVAGPLPVRDGRVVFADVVTTPLVSLWLVEVTPPAGYVAAAPIRLGGLSGEIGVDVSNKVRRGELRLVKVDEVTGAPLAGATLAVRYDGDGDGVFESDRGQFVSRTDPVTIGELLPGDYEVTEVAAPRGYALPEVPRLVVTVPPGGAVTASFADSPLTSVSFVKRAVGVFDPQRLSLGGAVFVVRDTQRAEVGRCRTDQAGRCSVAEDALVVGRRYCWAEVVAPAGFVRAAGGCFTAVVRASMRPVVVHERGVFTRVSVRKVAASDGRPLPGAVFELRRDGVSRPVSRAVSGRNGVASFAPVLPGPRYCVVEVAAPSGFQRDARSHCRKAGAGAVMRLTVPNVAVPAAAPPTLPLTGAASASLVRLGLAGVLGGVGVLMLAASRRAPVLDWPDRGFE